MARAAALKDSRLAELAREINLFVGKARQALPLYREAGSRLSEGKRLLGHGRFLPWVRSAVGLSPSLAARLMKIARYWHMILPVWKADPDLGINEAVRIPRQVEADRRRREACRRADRAGRRVQPEAVGVISGDFRV
jgi:hypothetical protein